MACTINIGKFTVDEANVQSALDSVKGVTDFDTAVVRSYTFVKDELPLGVWEKHLNKVWNEIPKSRKIKEEDFSNFVTEEVTELKDLLNMEGEVFTTARGEAEVSLTPQAQQAIATWKKHLINRGEKLSLDEVRRVLRSLSAVVKVGKRDSQLPKLQAAAKRAVKKKLASSLDAQQVFKKLLGIDIQYLRNLELTGDYTNAQMMEDYRNILETLSKREAVLTLEEGELVGLIAKANKILNTLGTVPPKVTGIKPDDPVERETLLYQFSKTDVDFSKLPIREERDKAKLIAELKPEDLEVLDNKEIASLIKGIESINKGLYQGHSTTKILDKIKEDQNQKLLQKTFEQTEKTDIVNGLRRLTNEINRLIEGSTKSSFYYGFRKAADTYAGMNIGDKNGVLFKKFLSRFANQEQKVASEKKGLFERHDQVSSKVGEKGRAEKIYSASILLFHEQFVSNEGQWSAVQLIDSYIKNGRNSDIVTDQDVKLLEKLRDKYVKDGELDVEKLKKDVLGNEKSKVVYDYVRDNSAKSVEKLHVTTATERGEAVPILVNHAPFSVLWTPKAGQVDPAQEFAKSVHPSSKSSAARERLEMEQGKVAPVVDFDLLGVSTRRTGEIITDYYMGPIMKELWNSANKTLENLIEKKASELTIDAARGWKQYVHQEIDSFVANNAENYNLLDEAIKTATKSVYVSKLFRIDRIFSEIVGAGAWWGINEPAAWAKGSKSDALWRKDLALILNNIGSIQQTKLTRTGVWDAKTVDPTWTQDTSRSRNRAKTKTEKLAASAYAAAGPLRWIGNIAGTIGDLGLSGPDKVMTRPGYLGILEREFKKLTGIQLTAKEYDLIAANDEAFMDTHKESLKAAAAIADGITVSASSTGSSVATISRFKRNAKDPGFIKFARAASGYLMNFSVNEGAGWNYYVRGLLGREEISRKDAVHGMAATLVRMAAYRPMMTAFAIMLATIGLGDDGEDEKEWSDVLNEFVRDFLGSLLTLTIQGQQGGWERQGVALLVEDINRKHLGWLRDYEDYNSWDHSLMFSLIRDRDFNGRTSLTDILVRFIGAPGAPIADASKVWKSFNNKYDNTDEVWDHFAEELILFLSSYTGMNPFYRDIINRRRKQRWEEAKKRKKKKKSRSKGKSKRTSRRRE